LRAWWTVPGIDPEANAFLATVADEPVGYGLVRLRKGDERSGFSKFVAHGLVLPEWRGRGIGTRILAESERRARARLDEAPTATVYFDAYADVRQSDAIAPPPSTRRATACALSCVGRTRRSRSV